MNKITLFSAILILTTLTAATARAATDTQVHAAIDQELDEKKKQSGTLDLYDETINKVRNLRLMDKQETVVQRDGKYYVTLQYRDINEGDIVEVEAEVAEDGEDILVERFVMTKVTILNEGKEADKEYSDEEVQDFMKDYLEKQTQFNDGKLMLFDPTAKTMRNLELIELNPEVRRMGILMSSSSQFKDADSGEIVDIDISVQKKDGQLTLQATRIRNVRKAP